MNTQPSFLAALGVFGFDAVEPVILASLITQDPMLLIGRSGTGKTYLLNSLSEALGLEHRHYNASLVSFDDLVGFPFPDGENNAVKFLETPATVWGAESVLIDEISRCKPEHQNRLFSLVHERRVQGIALPHLRFRWAAMNPCNTDQDGSETYIGSEPLDPALADRFSLLVPIVDWPELSDEDRLAITNPAGEGRLADDGGLLAAQLVEWRGEFEVLQENCPKIVLQYASRSVTELNGRAGVRISPRRARLLARSLLATLVIAGEAREELFRQVLECSIPHPAWGEQINPGAILAVHRVAWDIAFKQDGGWVHNFMAADHLKSKLAILLKHCNNPEEGTQAVAQFLASEPPERKAAFAAAIYPAAVMGKLPIGAEAVNELGKHAGPVLSVNGEVSWDVNRGVKLKDHPDFERFARVLADRGGARRERARQLFNWCLVQKVSPREPAMLESELNDCVTLLKRRKLV